MWEAGPRTFFLENNTTKNFIIAVNLPKVYQQLYGNGPCSPCSSWQNCKDYMIDLICDLNTLYNCVVRKGPNRFRQFGKTAKLYIVMSVISKEPSDHFYQNKLFKDTLRNFYSLKTWFRNVLQHTSIYYVHIWNCHCMEGSLCWKPNYTTLNLPRSTDRVSLYGSPLHATKWCKQTCGFETWGIWTFCDIDLPNKPNKLGKEKEEVSSPVSELNAAGRELHLWRRLFTLIDTGHRTDAARYRSHTDTGPWLFCTL